MKQETSRTTIVCIDANEYGTYTHTIRNSKSVAFVIWTLSLTCFKYVTQLNHYNHWFILITASRPRTMCNTHRSTAFLPTPYILSVKYFAESYFRKLFHCVSFSFSHKCLTHPSFRCPMIWIENNEPSRDIRPRILYYTIFKGLDVMLCFFFILFSHHMRNHQRLTTFMHGRAP